MNGDMNEPRDSALSISPLVSFQEVINPKTRKAERIFVNLNAVYPNAEEECTFEEVMARRRGWLDRNWPRETKPDRREPNIEEPSQEVSQDVDHSQEVDGSSREVSQDVVSDVAADDQMLSDLTESKDTPEKESKPRKKKVMEVKAETQTSTKHLVHFIVGTNIASQNKLGFTFGSEEDSTEEHSRANDDASQQSCYGRGPRHV